MDKLKQLVATKRKATDEEFGGRKYVKRAELEDLRLQKLKDEEETEPQAKVCEETLIVLLKFHNITWVML